MNHFYRYHHQTEEGRQATLKFLELEDECDKHNMAMLQSMDLQGVTKGKIEKARKSFDIDTRARKSLKKKIKTDKITQFGQDRTWLMV